MSYAKLIHDFLDEGLSGPEEDSLFAELNRNSELRNEFNRQVKMHVITQNDMASIAPPLATTAAVFSALGFSVPVEPVVRPLPVAVPGSKFKKILGKYLPAIIALFISAVITAFIVMILSNDENKTEYAGKFAAGATDNSLNITTKSVDADKRVYPIMSSIENGNPQSANTGLIANNQRKPEDNQVLTNPTSPVERWIPVFEPAKTDIAPGHNELPSDRTTVNANDTYSSVLSKNVHTVFDSGYFIIKEGLSDISRYELLVRAANGSLFDIGGTFPQLDENLKSGSILNDKSIGVFYRLNDNLIVGLELGKEVYNQEFKYYDGGINKVQKQSPSLFWYGATLRYTPFDLMLNDDFYPYIQATAGGTDIGLLGKVQAGISLDLLRNIGVNIGYEYSGAQYSINKSSSVSTKHGLTIGLVYKLK